MSFRINPIYGTLDLVNSTGGSGGSVSSSGSTNDKHIVRWLGTNSNIIQDGTAALIQDGGAIEAQGFIHNRNVVTTITIGSTETMVCSTLEMGSGGVIVMNPGAQIIML